MSEFMKGQMTMDDDTWIEDAIAKELEAISDEQIDEETSGTDNRSVDEEPEVQENGLEKEVEGLIPSMQEYIAKIQGQSAQLQAELDECDELLHQADVVSARKPHDGELEELAKQEGLTVEELRQKVLREIEEEEKEERCLVMTDVAMDTVTDLLSTAQMSARGSLTGDEDVAGAFLTSLQTPRADSHGTPHASPADTLAPANTVTSAESGDRDTPTDAGRVKAIEPPPSEDATISTEGGTVAIVFDSEALERQLMKEVLEMEERRRVMDDQRIKEFVEIRKAQDDKAQVIEEKRQQKQEEIKREGEVIAKQREEKEAALRVEADALQKQIEQSLDEYEKEINELARQAQREKLEFENALSEEKQRQEKRRGDAATRIQKAYRGYAVRKEYGEEVKATLEELKERKYQDRIEQVQQEIDVRVEKERIEKEEKERKEREEKERKRIEEEERQRKLEEERLRKEEEKKRKEEEKKKKAEEDRLRKEEEKRKKEEERRKKEEEKKKKEEEKRKKEEEEKMRKEEEKRRKEEEKKRKEEEKRKKLEEEERLKREEEERKRKEVERIEEELKKEQERIAKEEEHRKLEELKKNEEKATKEQEESKREMDIAGAKVTPEQRGMTEFLIDQVARINSTEPPEMKQTPTRRSPSAKSTPRQTNSPGSKTPRPPSGKKPDSAYERPISGKKKLANQNLEVNHVTGNGSTPIISVDNTRKSIQSQHEVAKSRDWGAYLPKPIDDARLHWIGKQCKSLSKIIGEKKTRRSGPNKKPIRRPSSAKSLPPLDEQVVLAAARVHSLKMVTTVELCELPGCTLKSLSQCPSLASLTMTRCRLVTTDGLEECRHLRHLNLQDNQLEVLSLKELQGLIYADVSHNALASVHGLDGCSKLRYLDISHNKITRIGGLESLQSLHTLRMGHNQLITTRGLGDVPSLQSLDVSHNHLQAVDDLENLALLQELVATGNNLMQVPKLTNQVLLDKLVLSDNSISFLSGLTQTWLPMLRHLNLSQNSISALDPMLNFLLLEHLDLSNNQLLDTDQLLPALLATRYLLTLDLSGNPLCEERRYSERIQEVVPFLEKHNNYTVVSPSRCEAPERTEYERLCLAQSLQVQQLHVSYTAALRKTSSVVDTIDIHAKYFETSHTLATDMRYTHEYGVSMVTPKEIDMNFDVTKQNGTLSNNSSPNLLTPNSNSASKNKFEDALKGNMAKLSPRSAKNSYNVLSANSNRKDARDVMVSNSDGGKNAFEQAMSKQPNAGLEIARQLQSPVDPKASFEQNLMKSMSKANAKASPNSPASDMKSKFEAAVSHPRKSLTQNGAFGGGGSGVLNGDTGKDFGASRSYATSVTTSKVMELLKTSQGDYTQVLDYSATKIQACWRGYILRKRLTLALSYAKFDDLDDDLENFDEVNLGDFDFNMDDLDNDLLVPDTPQLPANHPVLGKPPSHPLHRGPIVPPLFDSDPGHGSHQQPGAHAHGSAQGSAQRGELANGRPTQGSAQRGELANGRPPLPPLSRLSDAHTYDSDRTARAKKEEKIAEDWGFKDSKTAELMLQRAKKLKYNAMRKKKLSQLDPKQRLELYKRLEEVSRVKVPAARKNSVPRKEYFQAREEEMRRADLEQRTTKHEQVQRTFEWVHTQVGPQYDVTSSRIQNSKNAYGSESNLPRMDPAVLAGGRAMLAGSPASLDVQSIESASTIADPATKPQRLWRTNQNQENKLPPIKTNSAPSSKTKERMSFRNPKTETDVGWGGGRKRNHLRN